jgi:hypothetical protein
MREHFPVVLQRLVSFIVFSIDNQKLLYRVQKKTKYKLNG